jgi:hypothetical protein
MCRSGTLRRSAIRLDGVHPAEAAEDAARALDLLRNTLEPTRYSSYLGHAYYALARALRAEGKQDEAEAAFRSAAEHLENTLGYDHPDARSARQLAQVTPQRP